MIKTLRILSPGALLFFAGSLLISSSACDPTTAGNIGTCSLDFSSEVDATFDSGPLDALLEASARFAVTSTELDKQVRDACNAIAGDLGAATSEETGKACTNAADAIKAATTANANVTLTVDYVPGVCSVSAQAIIDCTASCDASFDAQATPPTCQGGELSGSCSGSCTGSCSVQASASCTGACDASCQGSCDATVVATCSGTCTGQCEGTCSAEDADGNCIGTCTGTCRGSCTGDIEGTCAGTCSGSCSGSCTASASGTCEGSCSGSCDVDFVEPRCQGGTLTVEASAECKSACETDASFNVECSSPEIVLSYSGQVSDAAGLQALVATLQTNYPAILSAAGKAAIVVDATSAFASQLSDAASTASGAGLEATDCLANAVVAQVAAASSISITVQASVEVSGSVSGGSN